MTKRGDFLRRKYGRYGYRRVRPLLVREGLKVRRNKLNRVASGSTTGRAYGSGRSVLWSYDSMRDHTEDGRRFRILTGIGPVSCSGKFSLLPAGGKTKSPHWRGSLLSRSLGGLFVRISSIALCAEFNYPVTPVALPPRNIGGR